MSTATKAASTQSTNGVRYLVVAALVVGAFLGAYRYALARDGGSPASGGSGQLGAAQSAAAGGGAGGAGCACCGSSAPTEGGITGDRVEGTAKVSGDVQTIDVDLSQGYYQPNAIVLKAGVPSEITFGQGSGCTAQVMSNELGFFEDLSAGPATVKLPALEKGEYPFYCGMQMVFGKIIVQ